ncbi:hypothetical protein ACI65C_006873 [Semiaphis heraclei]
MKTQISGFTERLEVSKANKVLKFLNPVYNLQHEIVTEDNNSNIVNFNMLSDEETFDTSVIKNKVSPDITSNKVTRHQILQTSTESNTAGDREKGSTPLQITSSGSQIFSHSGVENSTQKMLKSLLRNMVYLQTDIKHLSMIQIEILSKLDCTTNNIKDSINKTCSSNNEFLADDLNWPINDMQYLEVIEEKINDKNIRSFEEANNKKSLNSSGKTRSTSNSMSSVDSKEGLNETIPSTLLESSPAKKNEVGSDDGPCTRRSLRTNDKPEKSKSDDKNKLKDSKQLNKKTSNKSKDAEKIELISNIRGRKMKSRNVSESSFSSDNSKKRGYHKNNLTDLTVSDSSSRSVTPEIFREKACLKFGHQVDLVLPEIKIERLKPEKQCSSSVESKSENLIHSKNEANEVKAKIRSRVSSDLLVVQHMAYSVVHFFVDESVEAVPSFWVKGKTCAWPKNKIYAKKYIETKRIPSNTDFQFLKARELCRGLKSLNEAKEKANIARYKSDFTDDDDVYFNQNCNEPNSPRSVSSMPIFSSPESDKGPNYSKKCESALKIKRNKPQSGWSPSPKKFKSLKNDHAGNSLPLAKKSQTVRQLAFSKGHSTTTPVQKVELIKDSPTNSSVSVENINSGRMQQSSPNHLLSSSNLCFNESVDETDLRPLKEISTPEICFDRSKKLVTPSNDVNITIDNVFQNNMMRNVAFLKVELRQIKNNQGSILVLGTTRINTVTFTSQQ